jgi:hypothetical protein
MAVMIGEGMMLSRDWPAAMTMATFHEYLMWSSVVPAVPCTAWVLLPQTAAARSSASQLFARSGVADQEQPAVAGQCHDGAPTVAASPKNSA